MNRHGPALRPMITSSVPTIARLGTRSNHMEDLQLTHKGRIYDIACNWT